MAVCVEKTRCYRRFTTRMRLFPHIFSYLPFDYRAENFMNSYIHLCFTLLTIWTSINTFIFLAPYNFLGSRLPCLGNISKRFPQSFNPLRKSNDSLNCLEKFPLLYDASNKSLYMKFFSSHFITN